MSAEAIELRRLLFPWESEGALVFVESEEPDRSWVRLAEPDPMHGAVDEFPVPPEWLEAVA